MKSIKKWSWMLACLGCLLWSGLHCTPPTTSEATPEAPPTDGGSNADTTSTPDTSAEPAPPAERSIPDRPAPPDNRVGPDAAPDQSTTPDRSTDTAPDASPDAGAPELSPEALPEPTPERPTPPRAAFLYVAQTTAITTFRVNATTRKVTRSANFPRTGALRFLAFHPNKKFIYAVNQNRVEAYAIQPGTSGALKDIGSAQSGESGTHLDVDHSGKFVFVASYGGNQVSMLPIAADGKPQPPTFTRGGKTNTTFCQKAHQVRVHPDNKFVYVPCLGSDHILVLGFDATTGKVTPKPVAKTPAGAGPRHLDFHPNKKHLYVVNETKSSVIAFNINRTTGKLTQLQEITTLPQGTTTPSRSSDIHVSPDGKMVFAVNREPLDNIAMFSVAANGRLSAIGHVSTGGVHARSFTFGPKSEYVYVGNTRSKSMVLLKQVSPNMWLNHSKHGFPTDVWFVGLLEP